jgi:coproporphyrinogen III oxidase-like Fe-S oxidoreductase
MYKGVRFSIKADEVIRADIEFAAAHCRQQKRLFLCDGDALIIPQKRLIKILEQIRTTLPWLERVGIYANPTGILRKSSQELATLKNLGLGIAYLGLESGDDVTLTAIHKGADSQRFIDLGNKIRAVGIKLSITVLLGIAQKARSAIHAQQTGRVLSAIDPEFVGALSLMLSANTPLHQQWIEQNFYLLKPAEMLEELRLMLAATHLSNGFFHANHASNYLPIKAKLPEDKQKTLSLIAQALAGTISLKPEHLRGL